MTAKDEKLFQLKKWLVSNNNMTAKDEKLFQLIFDTAKKRWFPKLKLVPKSRSKTMLLINWLFNLGTVTKDRFLFGFFTTLAYTIYYPDQHSIKDWVGTLCHELCHCWQAKQETVPIFGYKYGFPITSSLTTLLFCWTPWLFSSGWTAVGLCVGLVVLAGVQLIPQLPDYWRSKYELEAYTISMYVRWHKYQEIPDWYITNLVGLFTDMSYYRMRTDPTKIKSELVAIRDTIKSGDHPIVHHPIVKLYHEMHAKVETDSQY